MKAIIRGWCLNYKFRYESEWEGISITYQSWKWKRSLKTSLKILRKIHSFSYLLDTGFSMKKVNCYNWQLQRKTMSAKKTSALGPVRLLFSASVCQKRLLAKDLKKFECMPTSVSKHKKVSWQKVYSICLNREEAGIEPGSIVTLLAHLKLILKVSYQLCKLSAWRKVWLQ